MHLHTRNIPGYDYGAGKVAKSPTSLDELKELKASYRFTDEDVVHLFDDAGWLSARMQSWGLVTGSDHILGVAAAILMHAVGRELQNSVGELAEEMAVM